jgi:hypothetical protein
MHGQVVFWSGDLGAGLNLFLKLGSVSVRCYGIAKFL